MLSQPVWDSVDVDEFREVVTETASGLQPGQWVALIHPLLPNAPAVFASRISETFRAGLSPSPREVWPMPTDCGAVLISNYWLPPSRRVKIWHRDVNTVDGCADAVTVACSLLFPAISPDGFDFTAGTTRRGGPMPNTGPLSEFLSRDV